MALGQRSESDKRANKPSAVRAFARMQSKFQWHSTCARNYVQKIWQVYLSYTVRSYSKTAIVLLNSVHNRSDFLFSTWQGSNFSRYQQSNGATTNRAISQVAEGQIHAGRPRIMLYKFQVSISQGACVVLITTKEPTQPCQRALIFSWPNSCMHCHTSTWPLSLSNIDTAMRPGAESS